MGFQTSAVNIDAESDRLMEVTGSVRNALAEAKQFAHRDTFMYIYIRMFFDTLSTN